VHDQIYLRRTPETYPLLPLAFDAKHPDAAAVAIQNKEGLLTPANRRWQHQDLRRSIALGKNIIAGMI
jgi:hypothetical protein